MKSSTLKRVLLCVIGLIIGGIGGYLLANHQFHKKSVEETFPTKPYMNPMFYDPFQDFKHKEKYIKNMFEDFEKDLKKEKKDIWDNRSNLEDLKELSGDSKSNGTFHYYEKLNNNGKESSYNVNGKWNDGKEEGSIIITGTNVKGKDFSYSGTIHNGKSEGKLVDENGNTKNINFEKLNLKEIYNNSNNLSE